MSTWYNRHRSVGPTTSNGSHSYLYRQGNCSNGNITVQSQGTSAIEPAQYLLEEMYDVVTPNFRSRMRRGEIINNPYVHTWNGWTRGSVSWQGSRTANCPSTPYADYDVNGSSYHNIEPALPIDQDYFDGLIVDASTACQARFNSSAVQGLVILGQLRQTLNLLRNPLGGISKLVGRQRGRSGTSLVEAVSQAWLVGRFGWRPLMYDIEDVMEATVERNNNRLTARASSSGTSTASRFDTGVGCMSHAGCTRQLDQEYSYSVRCGILGEVVSNTGYTTGIRLRDIPSAAWELLPYSFVADWFLNIGNYIGAVIPGCDVKVLAKWTTTDIIGNLTETITPGQYSNYTNTPSSSVVSTRYSRVKQRAPGLVPPSITLRTGSIEKLLSGKDWRVLDTLALIASGGKRKGWRG